MSKKQEYGCRKLKNHHTKKKTPNKRDGDEERNPNESCSPFTYWPRGDGNRHSGAYYNGQKETLVKHLSLDKKKKDEKLHSNTATGSEVRRTARCRKQNSQVRKFGGAKTKKPTCGCGNPSTRHNAQTPWITYRPDDKQRKKSGRKNEGLHETTYPPNTN